MVSDIWIIYENNAIFRGFSPAIHLWPFWPYRIRPWSDVKIQWPPSTWGIRPLVFSWYIYIYIYTAQISRYIYTYPRWSLVSSVLIWGTALVAGRIQVWLAPLCGGDVVTRCKRSCDLPFGGLRSMFFWWRWKFSRVNESGDFDIGFHRKSYDI